MGYLSKTYLKLKSSLVCPYIDYFTYAQSFWNVGHCTAVILPWSVQNIKKLCKLKGMLLTNEILRDLRLRWVSGRYPPALDSPIGARLFQLFRVTRLKLGVTEICARGLFFLSLLLSNMKSCTFFEIHRWSILLISILLILMIAPLHIFMLCIHPWARIVFHVQFHHLMIEIYLPNIIWIFTAVKFNLTSVMRF